VRVSRALRGLDGPCLGQLMDGLGQLMRGLGQLMDGLGQLMLVLPQLLVLCRKRPPRKSRQLILGLCQLILEQVELLGQGLCQPGRKLESPDKSNGLGR
jgi:X-X-X-Leu-X-X-Gly heptad repeat protein